jgi:hypothetical protein
MIAPLVMFHGIREKAMLLKASSLDELTLIVPVETDINIAFLRI